MNGFIGALAAQLALKPVSPAADGIAPRPRRPVAECPRAPGRPHVNAPPHPADGARRCPSRAPGRRRASMSRLLHRGGAHRRSWAPPHPAGGLGRGMAGTSMLPLAQPRGWLCWRYAAMPDCPMAHRGSISPSCIQNELALARSARHASEMPRKSPPEDTSREYLARKEPFSLHKPLESCTSRRSCHDSAFARPCARKARGAGYRKCTSYCGRRPHHRGCAHLRQPCATTAAAALWPVAQPMTGSAAVSEQCSTAYARPAPRHPPARSNLRRRRFSAAARPMTVACPHGASCSTAAARTSTVGGALPST